jgi:hypothetical protein
MGIGNLHTANNARKPYCKPKHDALASAKIHGATGEPTTKSNIYFSAKNGINHGFDFPGKKLPIGIIGNNSVRTPLDGGFDASAKRSALTLIRSLEDHLGSCRFCDRPGTIRTAVINNDDPAPARLADRPDSRADTILFVVRCDDNRNSLPTAHVNRLPMAFLMILDAR